MAGFVKVLIVDDNPQDRTLVARELEREFSQTEIHQAFDPDSFERLIGAGPYDIVITDYQLNWSNGVDVLKRSKRAFPLVPVIMFTGTGSEEVAVEAMKNGLDDYVVKTVSHLLRLRASVRSCLDHARTRQRARELEMWLRSILTRLDIGVFRCGSDGEILDCNDVTRRMLAVCQNGSTPRDNLSVLFPSPDAAQRFFARAMAENTPLFAEVEVDAGADNSRWFLVQAVGHAQSSRTRVLEGMLEDITRRRRLESQRQQAIVAASRVARLSARENEVMTCVVTGMANKVIANQLHLSEKTIEKHRANVMRKMKASSVAELVRLTMLAESLEELDFSKSKHEDT